MARFAPLFVISCLVLPAQALAESKQELAGVLRVCRGGSEAAVAKAHRLRGRAAVRQAAVLPNPSLVVEHQRALSGAVDRETVVGLLVPLGVGGRRGLLQQAADARRKQAFAEGRAGLFEAALEFREAYARAAVERARVQVLAQNQTELDALTTVIQKLERAGEAAAYDQLRHQARARVHRQQLQAANAKATAAELLLKAWLERDVTIDDAETLTSDAGGVPRSAAAPLLEALQAEAQASELEARAARRRAAPDISLFAGYRAVTAGTDTGHGVSLGLELPLTLFDHGQGEAATSDADAQLLRSLALRLKRRNDATVRAGLASLTQLRAALSEAQAAVRDVMLARERSLQLYAAGEASLTELLDTCRAVEEAQLLRLDLVQDIALTRLGVMRAAGTQLDATLDRECRDGNDQADR